MIYLNIKSHEIQNLLLTILFFLLQHLSLVLLMSFSAQTSNVLTNCGSVMETLTAMTRVMKSTAQQMTQCSAQWKQNGSATQGNSVSTNPGNVMEMRIVWMDLMSRNVSQDLNFLIPIPNSLHL